MSTNNMTEKQKNDLMTRKLFQGVRDSQRLTQGMTEKQIQDLRAGRMPTNPTAQYGPQQSAFTPPSTLLDHNLIQRM